MVFDETCRTHYWKRRWPLGLSHAWAAGGLLYRGLFRLDASQGVRSWGQAFDWILERSADRSIGEIQFWGHGKWGGALVDRERLTVQSLAPDHDHCAALAAIRDRMSGPDALWWFRTCETFGAERGQAFARAFTSFMGCRAAGHTYVIGPWQSGLHSLSPGETPSWDPAEGLAKGTPERPRRAFDSTRKAPHTIHCLRGSIPAGW